MKALLLIEVTIWLNGNVPLYICTSNYWSIFSIGDYGVSLCLDEQAYIQRDD